MSVSGGLKAGKISKPYGLQGKVILILEPEAEKYIETNYQLFIDIDGQRVPFFIEEVDFVSSDQGIVKFEFLNSVEEAREVNGCEVYFDVAQKATSHNSEDNFNAVVGYDAFDQKLGFLGKVIGYISYDMNPVILINYMDKELIVPAVPELIQHIDSKEKAIHFQLPEGLTTL